MKFHKISKDNIIQQQKNNNKNKNLITKKKQQNSRKILVSVLIVSLLLFPETNSHLDQEAQIGILIQTWLWLLMLTLQKRIGGTQTIQMTEIWTVNIGKVFAELRTGFHVRLQQ